MIEYVADIDTDAAHADKNDAAHQENRCDNTRPAFRYVIVDNTLEDLNDKKYKSHKGDEKAKNNDHLQRFI